MIFVTGKYHRVLSYVYIPGGVQQSRPPGLHARGGGSGFEVARLCDGALYGMYCFVCSLL